MRGLVALSLLALGSAAALTWLRAEPTPERGVAPPAWAPASPPDPPPGPPVPAAAAPPPAAPASRELLRYATRDGQVGMTDDPARVPAGATTLGREAVRDPDAPSGPVAPAAPATAIGVAPTAPREHPTSDAGLEAAWRERVRRVEADLSRARADTARAERIARAACRRRTDAYGRTWVGESCAESKDELQVARERQAEIRAYLLEELPDECRRAGCLPGWIREAEEAAGPDPLADADRDGYDADGDGFDHDRDASGEL